jgi:hypothetical protein
MILSSLTVRNNGSGSHPDAYSLGHWGGRGSTTEVKRPECDDDHSPSSSAEVNEWNCKSTTLTCLHGVYRNLTFITFTFIFAADKATNGTEKLLLDRVR